MGYDKREQGAPETILYLEDGSEVQLPTVMEVCDGCDGRGTHVNPAIDSHGLGAEDFDADPDFAEDYFAGRYDVRCYVCGGRNVVEVVDESRLDAERLELWHQQLQDERDYRAEVAAERRMGA